MNIMCTEKGMSGIIKTAVFRAFAALIILFIVFGSFEPAFAKSGKITGQVVDKGTGEPIIGATIQIVGTTMGAAADVDGNYVIAKVEPGTYTLMVSAIGYGTIEINQVEVKEDHSLPVNIGLQSQVQETGTKIKVTAKALRNTEANLLRERAKSPSISDAISSEAMSRSGSGDAAEAVERVTGATVDGGIVYVRGLGGRYGSSKLNGAAIPAPNPEGNAVQMDLFPTNLLDNVSVEKTFTPDKAGNFSGGSVDLRTKDLPEELTMSFSSSIKYNSLSSLNDDFLAAPRSSTDWLAFDDGMRDIPAAFQSDSVSIPPLGNAQTDPEAAYRLDSLSKQFKSAMKPTKRESPLNQSYAFSFGNSYDFLSRPLGILASLSYGTEYSYYDDGKTGRYTLTGGTGTTLEKDFLLDEVKGVEKVSWGGLLSANYSLHQNHKISSRFLYTREGEQTAQHISGEVNKDGLTASNLRLFETRNIRYTEQDVLSSQLSGEHFLRPFKLDWQGSFTTSDRNEPDVRDFSNEINLQVDSIIFNIDQTSGDTLSADTVRSVSGYTVGSGLYPAPTHYYRSISEENYEGQIDLEFPLAKLNGGDFKVKVGTSYLENSRDVREKLYKFYYGQATGSYNGDPDWYFSDEWMGIRGFDSTISMEVFYRYDYIYDGQGNIIDSTIHFEFDPFTGEISFDTLYIDTTINYDIDFGGYVFERTATNTNNFTGEKNIFATYAMVDFNILPRLRMVGGARLESTEMTIKGTAAVLDTLTGKLIDEDDWLPSVNLTYSATDKMNVRLAYGKTLARPSIRELSPMVTYEFTRGAIYVGNTALERTLIDNYDFRWEWFTAPGEILAVSTFYKHFKNPIERTIISNNNEVKYKNVDKARVYGAEFEVRENLGRLVRGLHNFNVEGNLSVIKSEVKLSEFELLTRRQFDSTASDTRPLQGQSEYIVNFNLNYNNYRTGTDITLLYNVFGERLTEVSEGGAPDVFEQPRADLDFTLSQKLMAGLKLKGSVKNILGTDLRKVIHYKGTDYTFASYSRGTSYSIGLSYSL